jgi:hypothetical protein
MLHIKKGFADRVNIYSLLGAIGSLVFGAVMSSGLFIFLGLALLVIGYFSLSSAVNKHRIVRINDTVEVYDRKSGSLVCTYNINNN